MRKYGEAINQVKLKEILLFPNYSCCFRHRHNNSPLCEEIRLSERRHGRRVQKTSRNVNGDVRRSLSKDSSVDNPHGSNQQLRQLVSSCGCVHSMSGQNNVDDVVSHGALQWKEMNNWIGAMVKYIWNDDKCSIFP